MRTRPEPICRPDRTVVALEDARAELHPNGSVVIRPHGSAAYLGVYDLAELLRIACGTDAKVLEIIACLMVEGHRFRSDFQRDRWDYPEEDPF